MASVPEVAELVERVAALRARAGGRVIIGIVGEPGSGKSTLGGVLVAACADRGLRATLVPMDGFHLANLELSRLGLSHRKGAPETFDAGGYAALLRRLRTARGVVYAPTYDRSVEESIANAIPVPPESDVLITEGNYLLFDGPWSEVARAVDEVWALRVDPDLRRQRLVRRHEEFGKSPAAALAWVESVDEPNAALIRATLPSADLEIWELPTS